MKKRGFILTNVLLSLIFALLVAIFLRLNNSTISRQKSGLTHSFSPMNYYNSLVAGGDMQGFRDGAFSFSRFYFPTGLAFNDAGDKLYVADSYNHRIRIVDLSQNNEVKTLAGKDSIGSMDGPLSTATFNFPYKLATLPYNRLVVFDFIDSKNGSIRLIDLQNKTVSTLAKCIYIRDMVYRPKDDCLYFSEPDYKKVEKMNMKSLMISTVFSNNSQIPSPGALCLYENNLCVADCNLPTIYEVTPENLESSSTLSISFSALGKAQNVLALSSSDDSIYALQKGGFLVKVGLPDSSIVTFPTPWGFLFKNQDYGFTLFNINDDIAAGFSVSPSEPRKFYISTENSIMSVKDYDFEKRWSAEEGRYRELTDFNYPTKKPAGTFRILAVGSSRNSEALSFPQNPNKPINEEVTIGNSRIYTFPKKLEFLLNTEAALQNSNIHFEVLNLTRRGYALSSFAYYEVPDLVKKYDIDLVIGEAVTSGYTDYYTNPMTREGIPGPSRSHQFMETPLSKRAPSGAARDLIKRCKILKIPFSDKQDFPGDGWADLFCNNDESMQKDLREMTGRRLQLLNEKLNSMKTSEGTCPQFVIYYIPNYYCPNDCWEALWTDTCDQYHLKFLDLTEPYNTLKVSYYPTNFRHFTAYGNELVAQLLGHYLVENKFIPLETTTSTK